MNKRNGFSGGTPLHMAVFSGEPVEGRLECAKQLLEAGADLSIRNNMGDTALDYASREHAYYYDPRMHALLRSFATATATATTTSTTTATDTDTATGTTTTTTTTTDDDCHRQTPETTEEHLQYLRHHYATAAEKWGRELPPPKVRARVRVWMRRF